MRKSRILLSIEGYKEVFKRYAEEERGGKEYCSVCERGYTIEDSDYGDYMLSVTHEERENTLKVKYIWYSDMKNEENKYGSIEVSKREGVTEKQYKKLLEYLFEEYDTNIEESKERRRKK